MLTFLVTTSQFFGRLDIDGTDVHVARIHEGSGCYTGLSWSEEYIYVMSLSNEGSWDRPSPHGTDALHVFDKHLKLVNEIDLGTRDAHQVHWHRDRLLVCDTGHDRLLSWPQQREPWVLPTEGLELHRPPADRHHLNSVWSDGRDVWVIARYGAPTYDPHAPIHSEAWRVDLNTGSILQRVPIGREAHNLCVHGGIWTCSSLDHALHHVAFDGAISAIELNAGYPRGLAVLPKRVFVGAGARGARAVRHHGTASVITIRNGVVRHRHAIPEAGQIYTLRAVNAIDYAHHGRRLRYRS